MFELGGFEAMILEPESEYLEKMSTDKDQINQVLSLIGMG